MDRETILQAEHDVILEAYDWLNDKESDSYGKIQYVLGAHDLALVLLNRLESNDERTV